jgi:putative DNA primase/helicase
MNAPAFAPAPACPWQQLADLGFSIFPVEYGGKRPLGKWKQFQTERPTPAMVNSWSAHQTNIGIATGAVSGLLVLDLDTPEAVEEAEALGLPDTLTVRTGKGLHAYFQHPGGELGNRAGLKPGWDIRGDGGYVVAPGSLHPSGARYEWQHPPGLFDLAPIPDCGPACKRDPVSGVIGV